MIKKIESAKEHFYNKLEKKIQLAIKLNKPIKSLVEQQIKLLEEAHDEFISTAKFKGFDMQSPQIGEIEIQQFSAMKALAQKIGLPVDKYDELIKNVKIRILGEENYKKFFEK